MRYMDSFRILTVPRAVSLNCWSHHFLVHAWDKITHSAYKDDIYSLQNDGQRVTSPSLASLLSAHLSPEKQKASQGDPETLWQVELSLRGGTAAWLHQQPYSYESWLQKEASIFLVTAGLKRGDLMRDNYALGAFQTHRCPTFFSTAICNWCARAPCGPPTF